MRRSDLPAFVLQDVTQSALQDPGPAAARLVEARGVEAEFCPRSARADWDGYTLPHLEVRWTEVGEPGAAPG